MSKIKLLNNQGDELTLEHSDTLSAQGNLVVNIRDVTKQVDTIADLKLLDGSHKLVYVTGYHTAGDGAFGSHFFEWDATSVEADNGGTIIALTGVTTGRYKLKYDSAVNVKWFGAKGSTDTPKTTGDNILTASCNTWNNTPFKYDLSWSPYGTSGSFVPSRAKPFANDDTWDYIGISLALWLGESVYIPAGKFYINMDSSVSKGSYNGLLIMKGQQQTIYGAGKYDTIITTLEDNSFFNSNQAGVSNAYKLFTMYRTGGKPTIVKDLSFQGPYSYNATSKNLTLLFQTNINGIALDNLWLSTCDYGIWADTSSGDSTLSLTTSEFCFGASLYTDSTSEYRVDFCNMWSSSNIQNQKGIVADGALYATNNRFFDFYGGAVTATNGVFSNNHVEYKGYKAVIFLDRVVFNNNIISGSSMDSAVTITKDSTVVGNTFSQSAEHPCLNLGDGSANSATNIEIIGNTFIKTNNTVSSANNSIIALYSGNNYTDAATESCIITGNTFQGNTLKTISNATITKNTFDGILQDKVFTKNTTYNGNAYFNKDVIGKEIMNASAGTSNNYSITITGMLGIGDGSLRAQSRLNLVTVISSTPGHVVRGWALYTSDYAGNAKLISTLGKSSVGGDITFSASGSNPIASITNLTTNVPSYSVSAIPLI